MTGSIRINQERCGVASGPPLLLLGEHRGSEVCGGCPRSMDARLQFFSIKELQIGKLADSMLVTSNDDEGC